MYSCIEYECSYKINQLIVNKTISERIMLLNISDYLEEVVRHIYLDVEKFRPIIYVSYGSVLSQDHSLT